jgi:methionyl-tRNA formyltransferase
MTTVFLGPTTPRIDLAYLLDMHADIVVSCGYRHIIKEPILSAYKGRIINQHISLLPYNRGADPNFWSLYDDTPKGITIHLVDKGLDTGPILARRELTFEPDMTMRTSYQYLQDEMAKLWSVFWPLWCDKKVTAIEQSGKGTYHRSSDLDPLRGLLAIKGWDTPISEIIEAGQRKRASLTTDP